MFSVSHIAVETPKERVATERTVEGMMNSSRVYQAGGFEEKLPSEKKNLQDWIQHSWVEVASFDVHRMVSNTTSISHNPLDKVSKTLEQCHHNPGFARRWMPVILESYSGLLIIWPLIWIAKTPWSAVGLVISEQFWEARSNLVGNCLVGTIAWNFLYLIGP